jgi:hypothetical protein
MRNVFGMDQPMRLHGGIDDEVSILSHDLSDHSLASFMTLQSNRLQMVITNQENDASTFAMRIRGDLNIQIEPQRNLTFGVNVRFNEQDPQLITIRGVINGIYEDVFGMRNLLDLVTTSFSGYLTEDGQIRNYNITGLGAFGVDCYNSRRYLDVMTRQANMTEERIAYSYDSNDEILGSFINSQHCIIGDVVMNFEDDYVQNDISASFNFESMHQVLAVVFGALPGDRLPALVRNLGLTGHQLLLDTNYDEVHPENRNSREIILTGVMDLYNIT